jgi:hypothetical protein
VPRRDLGVATSSVQFFRNVGSTIGIALCGTIMATSLPGAMARYLPPEVLSGTGPIDAGAVLDPAVLATLPPAVAEGVRQGLADALHNTFLLGIPLGIIVLVVSLFIKAIPLRETIQTREEAGQEMLDTMAQSSNSADELVPLLGRHGRTTERILGLQLGILAERASHGRAPLLTRAVSELGDGDLDRGVALLMRTATMLSSEDDREIADSEAYACAVAEFGGREGGVLSEELRKQLAVLAADKDRGKVLGAVEVPVAKRYEAVNLDHLRRVGNDLNAAFLVDISQRE